MFAKGNPHADGVKLVKYIMTGKEGERVEFGEARGFDFFHEDIYEAARLMDRMAGLVSKADNPWFHTQTRLPADERLTRAQWEQVVDRQEKVLGFTGQPRFWTMHVNEATGERHLHVAWYRIDVERECAINPGLYKNKLKLEVSRYLEKQLGLRRIDNERQDADRARYAGRNEVDESRRLGTDVRAIRAAILDCFEKSDSGKALKAALEERGMVLANADRRDGFMVIDAAGGHHALNKKLTGLTLAETRARLADLDRAQLPSVEQAKEQQAERQATRDAQEARQRPESSPGRGREQGAARGPYASLDAATVAKARPLGQTAGEIRLAWQLTATAGQFAQAIEDRGLILVHVSAEEAYASERASAFAKAIHRRNRVLREGFAVVDRRGSVTRIDQRTTGEQWEVIQKRLGGIDRRELLSVAAAREAMREANRIEWREHKQAERDAARPPTTLETAINAIHRAAPDRQRFNEALGKADIAITRATAADITALNRLQRDQELAQIVAQEAGITAQAGPRLATVREGELAAVTARGDVYRISLQHLEPALARQLQEGVLPGITQTRAGFEIERIAAATFRQEMIDIQLGRRAEATEARIAGDHARDAVRAQRATVRSTERETRATLDAGRDGIDAGNRLLGSVASVVSRMLDVLADMIAPAPPPTRDQAERMHRAAEEREAADAARLETEARLRETNETIRANARAEAERQAEEERIRQRQREQEQGRER